MEMDVIVLKIKILSLGAAERYALRRMVTAAHNDLLAEVPDLRMVIEEVIDAGQIGRYSAVLVLPTLVINEKTVCSGRFPTREEIGRWLTQAVQEARELLNPIE
jgi:hypothetical protein